MKFTVGKYYKLELGMIVRCTIAKNTLDPSGATGVVVFIPADVITIFTVGDSFWMSLNINCWKEVPDEEGILYEMLDKEV